MDACRIEGVPPSVPQPALRPNGVDRGHALGAGEGRSGEMSHATGRWPANVILDEDAAAMLDAQSGTSKSTAQARHNTASAHNRTESMGKSSSDWVTSGYSDTGGASRFFYVAKASRRERNAGLDGMAFRYALPKEARATCEAVVRELQKVTSDMPTVRWHIGESGGSITATCQTDSSSTISTGIKRITESATSLSLTRLHTSASTADASYATTSGTSHAESAASSSLYPLRSTHGAMVLDQSVESALCDVLLRASSAEEWKPYGNIHSTVKPIALMRYLIQLVAPPNGIVLDPFAGSGSTLVAAAELGFGAIGIELSEEYAEIAARRVDHALNERASRLNLEIEVDVV